MADSVQVLGARDMADKKLWRAFGAACSRSEDAGKTVLHLQKTKNEDGRCSWRAGSILPENGACGPFTLSFQAELKNIVLNRSDDVWGGFTILLHGHKDGKYVALKTERVRMDGVGFRPYTLRGAIPSGLTDLYLEFILQRASGSVKIRDISMKLQADGQKQRSITTKVVGGRTVELFPVPRHPVSSVPLRMDGKDFVFFDGTNTRQIYDTTIPEPSDLIAHAAAFGTPGELRRLFVGIHTLHRLTLKSILFTGLQDASGREIPTSAIEIFRVHNWPQSDGMGRSLSYSIVPEVLLPFRETTLQPNSSANFMVRIRIPKNTPQGIYSGKLIFRTNGVEKKLPLKLRVLPFTLVRPDNENMVYLVHVGNFGDRVEDAVEACREFKDRGIEGLVVACQYGKGMLQLVKDGNANLRIKSFGKLEQALAGYRTAEMTGPLILHFSDQLEIAVARAMGFELPRGNEAGGVNDAMKTPEFSDAMQKVLAEIKRRCAGTDLYIMCIDEPGGFVDRRDRAVWECREIRKAGLNAAVYQFGSFWKQLKDICRLQIFSSQAVPGQSRKETAREVRLAGIKGFAYGIHGSYDGYACGIMPGRARSGYLAHEEGFTGQTLWLYSPGKPMNFNGTEQLKFFPLLKYRGTDGRIVSTLQWEGLCEGIDDYAYMNTLDRLLARHGKKAEAQKIAQDYECLKKNLAEQIDPRTGDEEKIAAFSNRTADTVRWQIAEWIMKLQKMDHKI